ncbi:MAG: hypothetical protein GYB68_02670 [Chloroflexi bacterium]|nr:hypothetical protein [Chloroflexota bacterium]
MTAKEHALNKSQTPRRSFLKFGLLTGALVGCQAVGVVPGVPAANPTSSLPVAATRTVEIRYQLVGDAVAYSANPNGCDRTTIQGTVRDLAGNGVGSLTVHVWADDGSWDNALLTDGGGFYSVDVMDNVSTLTYKVQLVDSSGAILYSDVVVAQAIPDCNLNLMTLDFVAS